MNKFLKYVAILLSVVMLLTAIPFSATANNNSVDEIVNQDYENYLAAQGADSMQSDDYVPGEILFNLIEGTNSANTLSSLETQFGLEILERIDQTALEASAAASSAGESHSTLYRAGFDSAKASVYELCKAMNSLAEIENCEPNYTYAPESFVMPTEIGSSAEYTNRQKWYFDNMNLTSAWQSYETLGEGALVCVIDNGLNFNHDEIKGRLWSDAEGNHGYNAEFNNHDIYGKMEEGPAHGSHCAGIIAMEASNGGLVGVAPKAKIMACNAVTSSTGYFTNANLIKSLEYAVANGADVISMSLGGYSFSFNMEKALARASFSAVILCAAGNDGLSSATSLHFPSASAAVIGVMALGSGSAKNTLSSYSNYDTTGRYYQVAAPGTNIYAISAKSNTGYVSMTGTSMATPFMAGLAALYVSEYPDQTPAEARHSIIQAAGEMVHLYSSSSGETVKKARPTTMLGEACAPATAAAFTDRNVYKAVCDALHVDGTYKITNYDLECVTYLDFHGKSFKNYSALKDLTSLTYLNLSNTDMSDEDAANLFANIPEQVIALDLSDNHLTNLDFLTDYSGYLSNLNLSGNQIKSITGMPALTMLADLDLSDNCIKNIGAVSALSGLKYLYVPGNMIEDASPIINISHLEEAYFGNYNPNFTDFFGERYFLSGSKGNRITSLEPFMRLNAYSSHLHYINLSYNYVQLDTQFNYRAAKLLQIMSDIAVNHKTETIFSEAPGYKLVLSPQGSENLVAATDIAFQNDRNFMTMYLDGGAQKIPFSVTPADANFKTGVSFAVKDTSVAFVNTEGMLYPVGAGSTYVTLTLESGKVRTFFVTVDESYVAGADILNPTSVYTTDTSYKAIVYTAPCAKLVLSDQNDKTIGEYTSDGKYAFILKDKNGNTFIKWLVPFSIASAGSYDITAKAYNALGETYSQKVGTFHMDVAESFGNSVYGTIYAYNSHFDTTVSLLGEDDTVLQTQTLVNNVTGEGSYRFTGVANGVYSIKIEKAGYTPYYIRNITVNGDTQVDDTTKGAADITSHAGDINADEVIDIADVSIALAENTYAANAASAQTLLCDLDGNAYVDINDIAVIIQNI